ncbi:MAG: TraM recognition domain-containing protein [Alteromonas sp.]|nr:TraM recognition domain-containing protein [Alteromonas sp.]
MFDEDAKAAIQAELNPLLVTLEPKAQRLLKTYWRYHETIFATFDEKIKSGVQATVAQALAPFNHPELVDAFCAPADTHLSLQAVLDGMVYLVDMPLSRWGLGGKVAYTLIKLRFFNVMQSRHQHADWNQDWPVFFMCDEYQELVSANKDGLSDLNFWGKSRSSKALGMISAQSISSFYAALGDRDLSHALLQNFRQKICFRTEDPVTLTLMDALAGRAKAQRKTISQTTGESTRSITEPTSRQHSTTESVAESRESVLDATLFRHLTPNQAVTLLSLQGRSMDDVLELLPLFV